MHGKALLSILVICATSSNALAGDSGYFGGVDLSTGSTRGSSSTKDGGAPFAGGGVVSNLHMGQATGIGAHVGYRFDSPVSIFLSYQHIQGNISWDANFPAVGAASSYAGQAISQTILANIAYAFPLSVATAIRTTLGIGASINTLSGVRETVLNTGQFLSDVANHDEISPAAKVALGIRQKLTRNIEIGLDAGLTYSGGFRTGDTRSGNLGVTEIKPYKIDSVWRTDVAASLRYRF